MLYLCIILRADKSWWKTWRINRPYLWARDALEWLHGTPYWRLTIIIFLLYGEYLAREFNPVRPAPTGRGITSAHWKRDWLGWRNVVMAPAYDEIGIYWSCEAAPMASQCAISVVWSARTAIKSKKWSGGEKSASADVPNGKRNEATMISWWKCGLWVKVQCKRCAYQISRSIAKMQRLNCRSSMPIYYGTDEFQCIERPTAKFVLNHIRHHPISWKPQTGSNLLSRVLNRSTKWHLCFI